VMNMAEKIGDGYGCKVVLADEMKQVLRKNANSKFGCRMLESLIRESALEAYTKILKSGKSMKECTILVENDIDSKVFYPGENFPEEKESEPDASELGLAAEGGQKKGRRKGKRSGNEAIPNVAKAQ